MLGVCCDVWNDGMEDQEDQLDRVALLGIGHGGPAGAG